MPSSPRRLERMTASGPCSARTWARAARMLGAVYRFIFMSTPLNQGNSSAAHRGDDADAAVFRNLVVGQYRQRGRGVAHQPRDPRTNLRRDQKHRRLTRSVLTACAVAERLLNSFGETGLESGRCIAAGHRILQHLLERRIERDDR